jgi:hypothetical protein
MDITKALNILHQYDAIDLSNMSVEENEIKISHEGGHILSFSEKETIKNLLDQAITTSSEALSPEISSLIGRVQTKQKEFERARRETTRILLASPIEGDITEDLSNEIFAYIINCDPDLKIDKANISILYDILSYLTTEPDQASINLFILNALHFIGVPTEGYTTDSLSILFKYSASIYLNEFEPILWPSLIGLFIVIQSTLSTDEEIYDTWQNYCVELKSVPVSRQLSYINFSIYFYPLIKDFILVFIDFFSNQLISDSKIKECIPFIKTLSESGLAPDLINRILYLEFLSPEFLTESNIEKIKSLSARTISTFIKASTTFFTLSKPSELLEKIYTNLESDPHKIIFDYVIQHPIIKETYNPVFHLLNKRWAAFEDSPEDKLNLVLSFCHHSSKHEFLQLLDKISLLSLWPCKNILNTHLHYMFENLPPDKRDEIFYKASLLTKDIKLFLDVIKPLSWLDLTDSMIEKLRSRDPESLLDCIKLLILIPPEKREAYCEAPNPSEKLSSETTADLESTFYPHFTKIVSSTNRQQVSYACDYLYKKFIETSRIALNGELGILILSRKFIAEDNSSNNPFLVYENLSKGRKTPLEITLPSNTIEGQELHLDLQSISLKANELLPQWTFEKLQTALGRVVYSRDEVKLKFTEFKTRNQAAINTFLASLAMRTLDELEITLLEDSENKKWFETGLASMRPSDETIQLNACLNYYLSKMSPPAPDSPEPLSPSEAEFLQFANVFIHCPAGRIEQLRTMYGSIEKFLPAGFQTPKTTSNFLSTYIFNTYQTITREFLENNSSLYNTLIQKPNSNPHEGQYLINLIGRRLGLLNAEISFDISTHAITHSLLLKTSHEILQTALNIFTPEFITKKIYEQLNRDSDPEDFTNGPLTTSLTPFLTGAEMGEIYTLLQFDEPDPEKPLVSFLCVRNILLQTNLFAVTTTPGMPVNYTSKGFNESGYLLES